MLLEALGLQQALQSYWQQLVLGEKQVCAHGFGAKTKKILKLSLREKHTVLYKKTLEQNYGYWPA